METEPLKSRTRHILLKEVFLYITPNTTYSIEVDRNNPSGILTVHFSFAEIGFNDGKWNITESASMLPLPPAQELQDAIPVDEQFQKLVDCWSTKLPEYEFTARTMLQQLLVTITQTVSKSSNNYAASLKVEKIIQYMHQNLNEKITLTELAKFVQMTPFYMARTFKAATVYTIIEYYNKLKIDKSKELLIEGN